MKIHLLGDSAVASSKWFGDGFYDGWGDNLEAFFKEDVQVLNYAIGGRSCRSFLNEGRFEDTGFFHKEKAPYGMGPALSQIEKGDYVFIKFMGNDDDTRTSIYRLHRQVSLGEPDKDGIYPTVLPKPSMKVPLDYKLEGYPECLYEEGFEGERLQQIFKITKELMEMCGENYYPYDCGATYKGYFLYYINKIREKGAIPIMVAQQVRCRFENGIPTPEPCTRGCFDPRHKYPYEEALKQLSAETGVPLLNMNERISALYEMLGEVDTTYLHNIKIEGKTDADSERKENAAKWPFEYDRRKAEQDYVGVDRVHTNHFGAFVYDAILAEDMYEQQILTDKLLRTPSRQIAMPEHLLSRKADIAAFFKNVDLFGDKA